MHDQKKRRPNSAPFSLALFVLMLGCVLVLAVFGARVYRALTESQTRNQAVRASLSYVAARLRAADEFQAVSVAEGPQGDALILSDTGADTGYETRIYLYEGQLVEEYAAEGTPYSPENAQAVAKTQTFAARRRGQQIEVTTDQGTIRVFLHTEESNS
ncbi:DUF4860 domain-containing protein [uncultured Gemmiger sp.]|uniref:DUF4860 domain-containing protein n=1 Tax=uncultured Gemmiger sp. TaxID=1623490 RepID=UPI0025FEA3A5|nr:DUF4860 domain-containing protein [uncultured Gemmiger sp.]